METSLVWLCGPRQAATNGHENQVHMQPMEACFGGLARHVCRWAMAMRQRKLGSHTPPCHRRMVITTLFSVMLAALQRSAGPWGGGGY